MYFRYLVITSPLLKGVALHLNKLEFSLTSLVEIGPVVMEKKMKMWKV